MDKLRTAFPISVSFSDGELPTAAKLRGLARQSKQSASIFEYAIGDLWNQSGDGLLSTSNNNALMIPNLARFLGATRYANPRVPYLPNLNTYTHKFYSGDGYTDTCFGQLSLLPDPGTTYVWTGASSPSTLVASADLVTNSTEFYVDSVTGLCVTYSVIESGWTITYTPNTTAGVDQLTTSTYNVIPDPDTSVSYGFRGCKIAYANGTNNSAGYVIYLPPRGPLHTRTLDLGPQSPYDPSVNTANTSDTPDNPTYLTFWQSGTEEAATETTCAPHYRYNLPECITSSWTTASQALPTGLIYLWDHSVTGTIIEGLSYYAPSDASLPTWYFVVSGAALDTWVTNNLETAGYPSDALTRLNAHDPELYPANGLRVITVGSDVSSLVGTLLQKLYDHDHGSGTGLHTKLVSHGALLNSYSTSDNGTYVASAWENDWHPQYVHRGGIGSTTVRDSRKGGMFGDLLFLSTSNSEDLSANSHGIRFGHSVTGPYLYYLRSADSLIAANKSLTIHKGAYLVGDSTNQPFLDFIDVTNSVRVVPHATAGEGLIVEDWAQPVQSRTGGAIHVARHYSGPYYDSVYGYEYSSGGLSTGWGRIRKITLSPSDFTWVVGISATDGSFTPFTTNTLYYYSAVGGVFEYVGVLSQPSAGQNSYATCHLKLPFAHYGIVNVRFAIRPITHPMGNSQFTAAIGYSGWYGGPYGTVEDYLDLNTLVAFSDKPAGAWTVSSRIFSPDPAGVLVEVQNDYVTDDSDSAVKVPFISIGAIGSADINTIYFSPVTVYYRIKEF